MLAYEYYYKERLFALKRARRAAYPFNETEILVSLEAISVAIEMAPAMIAETEQTHLAEFMRLLVRWGINPLDFPDEPYLDEVTANFTLAFVRRMETLFVRVEGYLLEMRGTARKSGVHFYGAESKEMLALDAAMGWKAFNPKEALPSQITDRIVKEVGGVQRRLQRNLDARRQHFIGVEEYIWRSSDDDKVRHAHAAYDDRVFRWDSPPPDGHPGEAFGCRCWAEPIPPLPPAPPLMSDAERNERIRNLGIGLATLGIGRGAWVGTNAALRGIAEIGRSTGKRLAEYQAERLARQTTRRLQNILMPNGKPIGKRGTNNDIRVIEGGESEAKRLFDELSKNGKNYRPNKYPGEGKRLPNGDWIGYRSKSKHGEPAIDLKVEKLPFNKIKFP